MLLFLNKLQWDCGRCCCYIILSNRNCCWNVLLLMPFVQENSNENVVYFYVVIFSTCRWFHRVRFGTKSEKILAMQELPVGGSGGRQPNLDRPGSAFTGTFQLQMEALNSGWAAEYLCCNFNKCRAATNNYFLYWWIWFSNLLSPQSWKYKISYFVNPKVQT